MQALDPAGEYSDAEVIAALTAQRGTRTITYRFDLLDASNNVKLTSIDGIISATVENNALAEIKRTAGFTIRDGAGIDYASDRIRPWARLDIPIAAAVASYEYIEDPSNPGFFVAA